MQKYSKQVVFKMNTLPHWAYDKSPDSRGEALRNAWGEFGMDFDLKWERYLEKLTEFYKDCKLDMREVRRRLRNKLDIEI